MQLYDITIAANSTRQLDAPGSYFYYYAGSAGGADSTITLRGLSSGLRLILKPGQAFRLPKGQTENAWIITNYANTATIIGSVLVGDGDVTDNRITGSVEVVDGGKNRSLSGSALTMVLAVSAQVGLFSNTQIWNPAASGKNVIIEQISTGISSAATVAYRHSTSALANNLNSAASKIVGASVTSLTVGRSDPNATMQGTYFAERSLSANQTEIFKPSEPYVLRPGYGLILVPTLANVSITSNIEFFEESI